MKPKSLIPLIIIFALLAGLVILKQMNKEQPTIVDQVKLEALVPEGAAKNDVAKLELFAGGKPDEKLIIERSTSDPNVWRVTSHFNAPADEKKIEGFLDKALALKGEPRDTVKDDAGLAPYQLGDDIAFHIAAYKRDVAEPMFTVLVGKAPKYNQVFMRAAGAKSVYTLDTNLRSEAGVMGEDMATAPKAETWLKKDVVNIAKNTISKITVETPDKRFVIAKEKKEVPAEEKPAETPDAAAPAEEKKEGEEAKPETKVEETWKLAEGGASNEVKQSGIENLAAAFAPLAATDVVDPAKLADWGLDAPKFKCSLTVEGKEGDVVIEGGRPDPDGDGYVRVATADSSVIFKLPKYTFEKIFPKGRDIVNLPALKVDKSTIAQIDVQQPEGILSLTKAGDAWTIAAPFSDLKPQTSTIESIATALASWQAADYADNADGKGLDAPTRTVTFTTSTGESHTIATGTDATGVAGRYARLDGTPAVLVMSKSDVDRVFVAPKDIYNHSVLDIDEENIARINVSRATDGFTLAKEADAWTVTVDGAAAPAKEDAADDLCAALASFQISDVNFGQADLGVAADATVQIVMADGTEHTLQFGPEEDGTHAVAVGGKAQTFRAESLDVKEVTPASASLKQEAAPAPAPDAAATEPPAAPAEGLTPLAPAEVTPVMPETPQPVLDIQPAPAPAPVEVAPAPATEPPAPAPEAAAPAPAESQPAAETPAAAPAETAAPAASESQPAAETPAPAEAAPAQPQG
ncbi:MAG: DUF4340 domain-containing protein [Candidatus Hydrogenedentes bacterium]|nr:DUF4340 domain-containing protein [Candidatus Hydrogenedentota bacterium]